MEYIPGLDLDSVCLTKKIAEDVREGLLKMNNLSIAHDDVKAKNIMVCNERVVWIDFSSSRTLPHIHGRAYERSLIQINPWLNQCFFILSHVRARYLTGPVIFSTLLTGPKLPINKGVCVVDAELLPSIDGPYLYLFRPELHPSQACKVILETSGTPSESSAGATQ